MPIILESGGPETLELVFEDPPTIEIALRALYKGERGDTGPAGDAPLYPTAIAIGGYRCVYFDATGALQYADSATLAHARRIGGVTRQAYGPGDQVELHRFLELTDAAWTWDTAVPVFLGHAGVLTQTVPVYPDAAFSLVLGMPLAPTKLLINVREPVALQ